MELDLKKSDWETPKLDDGDRARLMRTVNAKVSSRRQRRKAARIAASVALPIMLLAGVSIYFGRGDRSGDITAMLKVEVTAGREMKYFSADERAERPEAKYDFTL